MQLRKSVMMICGRSFPVEGKIDRFYSTSCAANDATLDPATLTIGFARRVAGYKRWAMLLTDRQRLLRLMNNEERPVQFIFAGKAHPQDEESKRRCCNSWPNGNMNRLSAGARSFSRITIRRSRDSSCSRLTCG